MRLTARVTVLAKANRDLTYRKDVARGRGKTRRVL
jgi:hypothetical protein